MPGHYGMWEKTKEAIGGPNGINYYHALIPAAAVWGGALVSGAVDFASLRFDRAATGVLKAPFTALGVTVGAYPLILLSLAAADAADHHVLPKFTDFKVLKFIKVR